MRYLINRNCYASRNETISVSIFADTPFGQVPLLEVDGETLCQSNTINRYIAKQHGKCIKSDKREEKEGKWMVKCVVDEER